MLCDRNWGVESGHRQTHRQTDRKVETKGPQIKIFSNDTFYFKTVIHRVRQSDLPVKKYLEN